MFHRLAFRQFCRVLLGLAAISAATVTVRADAFWIWAEGPGSREAARIRRTFEVPAGLEQATLLITCDNGARVFLDGQPLLNVSDWNEAVKADLTRKLTPGKHELLSECKNEGDVAGFVARLTLKGAGGKETVIETDAAWEATVPDRLNGNPRKSWANMAMVPGAIPFPPQPPPPARA